MSFTTGYDGLDRSAQSVWHIGTNNTPFFGLGYDALGRRTITGRASSATTYTYDAVSRLATDTQGFGSGSSNLVTSYAYNPANQVVSRTRSNTTYAWSGYVNVSRSYTVNGLNQYTAAGAASFAYNGDGNLTGDGTNTYSYDVENRLTGKSGGLAITYDPLGRLWQTSGGASGTTRYLYDGDQLVGEYNASGTMTARYFFGPGVDEPVMWDGGGMDCSQSRFLHNDPQGSIVAVANCWGAPVATNSYDEYGIPAATNIGRFQYTGQIWLPDLGMYYYKARMYSPSLGRFMQTDPIGYADQNNLYAYVGNDPIDRVDPSGTQTVPEAEPVEEPAEEENSREVPSTGQLTIMGIRQTFQEIKELIFGKPQTEGYRDPASTRPTSIRSGGDYSRAQKQEYYRQNMARNGGQLRSDRSGQPLVPSPKSQRGVPTPRNAAQIDHNNPRSAGGRNDGANARVLSAAENRAKSDTPPPPPPPAKPWWKFW